MHLHRARVKCWETPQVRPFSQISQKIRHKKVANLEVARMGYDTKDTVTIVQNIFAIVGIVIAVLSLAVGAYNLRLSRKTTAAKFALDVRAHLAVHHELTRRHLRGEALSKADEDRVDWRSYFGMFEHCEDLLEAGLLDIDTFEAIYYDRLSVAIRTRSSELNVIGKPKERELETFLQASLQTGPVQQHIWKKL